MNKAMRDLCQTLDRERAQAEYVAEWRASNAVEVWGPPWLCPLCNKALQDFFGLEAHAAQIEYHQRSHGADWSLYEAAGQDAELEAERRPAQGEAPDHEA